VVVVLAVQGIPVVVAVLADILVTAALTLGELSRGLLAQVVLAVQELGPRMARLLVVEVVRVFLDKAQTVLAVL
jgi:hypothetical protein